MKKYFNKDGWIAFTGFVCIAGIFYLLWLVGSFFVSNLFAIDPRISVPVIGTMITAIVGLSATIITQRQIKLREIEEAHREKKVEIYQKFIKTVTSLIAGQNARVTIEAPTNQELIDYLFTYKAEILLWGSPKVIKSQLEFEKTSG
jgi:membrane protein implicated in regulation of membrane protease activity